MNSEIQGWFDFQHIYDRAVQEAPPGAILIELGVWKGKSLCYLGQKAKEANKGLRVFGIDSFAFKDWEGYANIQRLDREAGENRTILNQCRDNLKHAGVHDFVTLLLCDSIAAADLFPCRSVRFIYVDDTHNSKHVEAELAAWIPKLKLPTWIAGHDFPGDIEGGVRTHFPGAINDNGSWVGYLK